MLLSILVPTIPERAEKCARLLSILDPQVAAHPEVELLVLRDNRKRTVGSKRNALIVAAKGDYSVFVDDDDIPSDDYVSAIMEALRRPNAAAEPATTDCVCFQVLVTGYGEPRICRYSPAYEHRDLVDSYERKPNHLMVIRRHIGLYCPFPDIAYGEDTVWAAQIDGQKLLRHTVFIDRPLYTYAFDVNDNARTVR